MEKYFIIIGKKRRDHNDSVNGWIAVPCVFVILAGGENLVGPQFYHMALEK